MYEQQDVLGRINNSEKRTTIAQRKRACGKSLLLPPEHNFAQQISGGN